ncbi:MAG: hypothetical protein WBG38_06415 [Nodosilinea sp.]
MATSSRPFQSRTVARLAAGYRQVTHEAGQWLRQSRIAAIWGLQVVAYPLYVAVQGVRVSYRRLRAARPWQPLWSRLSGTRTPRLVEADTPIRALLSVVQPPVVATGRPVALRLVSLYGQWLRQSRAEAVLVPGQWHSIAYPAPIRGIASELKTRQLVLVTTDNAIFTALTDDQRQRLQQAIVLMLAEYCRLHRRSALDRRLHQPWLPLPQANPAVLPPLRWLPTALRWLQTSPLAAATSLFGEAKQRTIPSQAGIQLVQPYSARHLSDQLAGNSLAASPLAAEAAIATSPQVVIEPAPLVSGGHTVEQSPQAVGPHSPAGSSASAAPLTASATSMTNRQLPATSALEAQVVQSDYIDAPLVAALRGLDWVLYVLETWLRGAWAWLQKHW